MHTEAQFQARVGQIIGAKYRLVRLIGTGGMGAVYEAENTWIKRRVAIKVLRPDLTRNQDAVQRFTQEAQAATQIEHPNIVFVMDMGQEPTDGALYIVQEFLTGIDLRRRVATDGKISVGESIATMLPIMNALVAAHERGIVHRDLKPENVFLARGPNGETVPKLIDFGVSKIMDSAGSLTKTQAGMALGTPYYMSPEQGRGDLDVDARTDVWAIGVVFFELLAGHPPFDGPNHNVLVLKILTERAPRLDSVVPHVPPDLATLIAAALEPDRDRRIPTMRVFRDALVQFAASHPELGIVSATATPAPGAMAITTSPTGRAPAPATAIHGTFSPQMATHGAPPPGVSPSAPYGATLPLGAAAGMQPNPAAMAPPAPRSPTLPLPPQASMTASIAHVPPPGLQATSLGWTAGPQPVAQPTKTPWLLFMAIAALSVFVGAAGVALLKHNRHSRAAVTNAPPVTRLALSPTAADAGTSAVTQPARVDAPAPMPNAPSRPDTNPAAAPPASNPATATAPQTPGAPVTAPTPESPAAAHGSSHRNAHAPSHPNVVAPTQNPPAQPAPVIGPAPVAVAPQPVAPQPVAPQPVAPPPRRVPAAPSDPLVQQANNVASQLQSASQQLAYSDPRRAQELAEDASRIQYEAEQIRQMEQQVRELQSVDPGTAQQLRGATDRQRARLQRMISRFTN